MESKLIARHAFNMNIDEKRVNEEKNCTDSVKNIINLRKTSIKIIMYLSVIIKKNIIFVFFS